MRRRAGTCPFMSTPQVGGSLVSRLDRAGGEEKGREEGRSTWAVACAYADDHIHPHTAPFINPDLVWDFRLPLVKSINASGHKFGYVAREGGSKGGREKGVPHCAVHIFS